LIEKFRVWKEEEKRRKAEREQLLATEYEEMVGDDSNKQMEEGDQGNGDGVDEQEISEPPITKPEPQDGQPNDDIFPKVRGYGEAPDIGDVDAWAAHQLHREVNSTSHRRRYKIPTDSSHALRDNDLQIGPLSCLANDSDHPPRSPIPPPVEEPFRSFYSKPHLRDAAVGKNRRGRNRTAFGHPLPEMEDRDFRLPQDILTDDVIEACKRLRRRLRRERRD
jgi:hypothetical protein